MKKKYLLIFFAALSAAALSLPVNAAWYYTKTEHFKIIYEKGLEEHASKVAQIAEKHYPAMTRQQGWEPKERVNIIINDRFDISNGYSTPIPFNTIMMYIPEPDPDGSIGNFDNWLENLFVHEFTHTLNMDKRQGMWEIFYYLFGRSLCFPNALLPMWQLEGNAVYSESAGGGGRLHSNYAEMVMRTDLLHGEDKSLADAGNFSPDEWPSGMTPYLYGAYFVNYLNSKFSEAAGNFPNQFDINSERIIPMRVAGNFNKQYGKTIYDQWEEFKSEEKERFEQIENKIAEKGLSAYRILFPASRFTCNPKYIDGEIYFIEDNSSAGDFISKVNPETLKTKRMTRVTSANSIAKLDGDVIYTDAELFGNSRLRSDIYEMDAVFFDRLTTEKRVTFMDAKDDKVCFITFSNGRYSLYFGTKDFDKAEKLISDSPVQITHCALSKDKTKIAFAYRIRDGKGSCAIAVLERASGKITSITDSKSISMHPAWTPDGDIVFSSDRTGIFNLYRISLKSGETKQITNVLGGAFASTVSDDGKTVVFSSYERDGFAVAEIKPDKTYDSFKSPSAPIEFRPSAPETPADMQSSLYLSLAHIKPWSWLYAAFSLKKTGDTKNNYGITTQMIMADPLLRQQLALGQSSLFGEKRTSVFASYVYKTDLFSISSFYVNERIFWKDDEFPFNAKPNEDFRRTTEHSQTAMLTIPFVKAKWNSSVSASYESGIEYDDIFYKGTQRHYKTKTGQLRGDFTFSNVHVFPSSVTSERGVIIAAYSENSRKALNDDYNINTYFAAMTLKLPSIFRNNVISLNAKCGRSDSEKYFQHPFSLSEEKSVFNQQTETADGIRGYRENMVFGNRYASATCEYVFPLFQKGCGISTVPLYHQNTFATLFFDSAYVYEQGKDRTLYRSAGAELSTKLTVFYLADITFTLAYAHGFDKFGENSVAFKLGTAL